MIRRDDMQKAEKVLTSAAYCLLLIAFFGMLGRVEAVSPKIWEESSQSAFLKGDPEGVSLTRDGMVTLAPKWSLVADTGEDFVWSLAVDAKGALYVGTGNEEGRIYVIQPGSTQAELLFDSPEVIIFSLTIGADGALYAGTSPGGIIYRIASGKEPEEFCQTGDSHVFALVARPSGGVYAGTGGERGRVLKVDKAGKVTELYASKDPSIVSLALGAGGEIYAGTDNSGLVYQIDDQGDARVIYDAREKEIHALSVSRNGVVYATAMAQSRRPDGNGGGQNGGDQSGAALYAIRPSGATMRLWEADDPMLLDSVMEADGTLKVITGEKGRVYQVWPDGKATLLAVLKDVNPWAMVAGHNNTLWIGASASGEVYRMEKGFVREGQLTSQVHDFDQVAQWGRAWWQNSSPSGTSVSVQTRSGNSGDPDDTWSDWSEAITTPGGQITSHPGRFLQYRLVLKTRSDNATAQMRSIRLAGLQDNVRPRILQIKAEVAGNDGDDGGAGKGVWKIDWAVGDVNDDELIYDLYFRSVGEARWRLLKDDLTSSHFLWRTEAVPDGEVEVKIVASDRLSNPIGNALTSEAVSASFEIDNSAPVVQLNKIDQAGNVVTVTGTIKDAATAVRKASYALNSDEWQTVFPADQIFDSPTESLKFSIGNLKTGSYTLVVKAEDGLGNVGVGKTTFEVK